MIRIQSNNGNCYQYDFDTGNLTSIPFSLYKHDQSDTDLECLDVTHDSIKAFSLVNSQDIIYQFINMPDLVFELTERCNLKCDYCIYGPAYNNGVNRSQTDLDLNKAKAVIDYIWQIFDENNIGKTEGVIGFYGGEPLLCFDTIKRIISYVKRKQNNSNLSFRFNMTTNAVMLSEDVSVFLDKNNVELLISLDGDKCNHSFRHFSSGENSFDVVIRNVDSLFQNHFEYFTKYVSFNSVIHQRNSMYEADTFVFERYGKHPLLSEIDSEGMNDKYKAMLLPDYSMDSTDNNLSISADNLIQNPAFHDAIRFIYNDLNYVYGSYIDFFKGKMRKWKPTGTCLPFGRKIFVSSKGFLFPCENVPRIEPFSKIINETPFSVDFDFIANEYNKLLKRFAPLCQKCYRKFNCVRCVYHFDDSKNVRCQFFMNRQQFESYLIDMVTNLEDNPDMFLKIIERVSVD